MANSLNDYVTRLKLLEEEMNQLSVDIKNSDRKIVTAESTLLAMQKAAKLSQDHLASHLSNIVTQAIQAVVEKPYEFVCEFVERRGSTEADMYLLRDGNKFDILGGTGGGLADVCSFALKVAYLLLSNVDKVLIIDEISRHVNSPKQREAFAAVIKKLSEQFEIQLILNSTIPEILAIGDNIITLSQQNEVTKVEHTTR